jgi:cytochrome c2
MKTAVTFLVVVALTLMVTTAFAADAENGKAVYKAQKCAMCHSIAGEGGKMGALDDAGKLKADDLKKWIKTPKEMKADSKMKAYTTLADKDLDDLVAYLQTLKK